MSHPDWSGWPAVHEAQNTDVTSPDPWMKYPFLWEQHDNEWRPVTIDWLNQGIETHKEVALSNEPLLDILSSNHLWLDQNTESTTWTDTNKESTVWKTYDYPKR